VSKVIILSFF